MQLARMPRALMLAGFLHALASVTVVHADSVYRCIAADGSVAYQDQPCRRTDHQDVVPLRAAAPPIDVSPPAHDNAASTAMPMGATPVAPPAIAPPSFFLCTRYDGSRYESSDGVGGRSAVPLGMLGVPERSLADAYGGRNGIGVSAPGLRAIPSIPSAQAPLAARYMWIDDQCQPASPAQACAWLRDELATLESKLRRAFSDEAPALKTRAQGLRERLRGC